MYRTVELTVRAKDLNEVLEKLKISDEFRENVAFTLSVDMKDEKESYEYLCKSEKIINWRLVEKENNEPIPQQKEESNSCEEGCVGCSGSNKKESISPTSEIEKAVNVVSLEFEMKNSVKYILENIPDCTYEDISNILVGTWTGLKKMKNLKFSTLFFKEIVVPYVVARRIDRDNTNVGTTLFIKTYYGDSTDLEEVVKDIVNKIRENWDIFKECESFPRLIGEFFGPNKQVKNMLGL